MMDLEALRRVAHHERGENLHDAVERRHDGALSGQQKA